MKKLFKAIICFVLLIAITGCKGTQETLNVPMDDLENYAAENGINLDTDATQTPEEPKDPDTTDTTEPEAPQKDETDPTTSTETPTVPDTSKPEEKPKDQEQKDPVTTPSTPTQTPDTSTVPEPTPDCKHTATKLVNQADATCTQTGYTGDKVCSACNQVLNQGTSIAATGHKNTELRNKKDATTSAAGYTGDTYCKDCGTKVSGGSTIPQLQETPSGTPYELPDGTIIYINDASDIRKYTMQQATKSASHQHGAVEKEILRLINIERNNAGLPSLSWYEDAYYFTKIRATECLSKFSHTRPNGKAWNTVYSDNGVVLGVCGENLHYAQGYTIEEIAQQTVSDWMNSSGHKANILNSRYKQIAIAIVQDGNKISTVQNFFG